MDTHAGPDIFVTRKIPGQAIPLLEQSGFAVEVHEGEFGPSRDLFLEKAASCIGLLTLLTDRVDDALFDRAPKLKVVSNYAVGYDNIDVPEATRRGILVTHTPGVLTDATAEIAIALLFAAARRIPEGDRFVRSGAFTGWSPSLFQGIDIHGKTLGIVGMGRIGTAVGYRARALGMEILYTDPKGDTEFERETDARRVPLEALLGESDFVSLHVPLTAETKGLIGREALARMKAGAILINTARGPVVDEKALAESLLSGHLRGAGLDVYEREPDVEPSLLAQENVVLLPHVGSATVETRDAMGRLAAENLLAALAGRKPKHPLNPEVWKGDG
ncbi:MAG: 2-hydroxyacid dehydrogenase [Planctomycetota bacterium]